MKWTKIIFETTTGAEDLVSAILNEMGIQGIAIEDKIQLSQEDKEKMFIDILPELPPDDGVAEITFYADAETDIEELKKNLLENLSMYEDEYDFGSKSFEISTTDDGDWMTKWKEYFKPFRIDDEIIIKPTWEKLDDVKPNETVIEIDPGTAFGTGTHETTKLCILNLKKYMKKNDLLLDVGCGSGILTIAGMKLGAKLAAGIDVDDNASRISVENSIINHIPATYADIDLLLPGREEAAKANVHVDASYTFEFPGKHRSDTNRNEGINGGYSTVEKTETEADGLCGENAEKAVGGKTCAETYAAVKYNVEKPDVENCAAEVESGISKNDSGEYICTPKEGSIVFMTGNVIDDAELRRFIGLERYDVVVANILADIIIPLSAVAGEFMNPGAIFISSGIIAEKEKAVTDAVIANGFEILEVTHMNEWVSVVARKPVGIC